MRTLGWVMLVAFGVVMVIGLTTTFSMSAHELPGALASLAFLTNLIGLFLATAAGLMLLILSAAGIVTTDRAALLTVALFAGLMMIGSNWGQAVGAAAIVVTLLWRSTESKDRRPANAPPQPAPSPPTLAFPVDRPNG